MTAPLSEEQWLLVVEIFRASRARRGAKGRHDRKFLEALHHLGLHKLSWRELPARFGNWNSVWKRYWRWRQFGAFDSFLTALAERSETAHLADMFRAPADYGPLGKDERSQPRRRLDQAVGPTFPRSRA
jgi:transposase